MPIEIYNIIILATILFLVLAFSVFLIIRKLFRQLWKKDLEFLQYTINAQERERAIIAQEIHDNIAPTLSIAQMQIGFLLEQKDPGQTETLLPKIQKQLQDTIGLCRDISHILSSDLVNGNNLQLMLEKHVGIVNQTDQLKLNLDYRAKEIKLKEADNASLIRIIQELISNTVKHAGAKRGGIIVTKDHKYLVINYWDDGKGLPDKFPVTGMGMKNIEKRVQILNGKLIWKNTSAGLSVTIKIPLLD
jgi:signal transduction histidine kinase